MSRSDFHKLQEQVGEVARNLTTEKPWKREKLWHFPGGINGEVGYDSNISTPVRLNTAAWNRNGWNHNVHTNSFQLAVSSPIFSPNNVIFRVLRNENVLGRLAGSLDRLSEGVDAIKKNCLDRLDEFDEVQL